MKCVTSVSYSLIINGEPQPYFKPSRGIHQGDPLSLYIYILYAKALSNILSHAERTSSLFSVPTRSGLLKINHIFFTYDILLFCKANSTEWSNLIYILN